MSRITKEDIQTHITKKDGLISISKANAPMLEATIDSIDDYIGFLQTELVPPPLQFNDENGAYLIVGIIEQLNEQDEYLRLLITMINNAGLEQGEIRTFDSKILNKRKSKEKN